MNSNSAMVTVQMQERTVRGPLEYDKAMNIVKMLMENMLDSGSPQPSNDFSPSHADGISPKQLDTLRKNPKWEQKEICEHFHVSCLEDLTKQQASEAIKTSMTRNR